MRILREAVARDPSSLKLHYSLAIASTYLERREEAVGEFEWVLANAPAGSPESQTARQWLADAGVRARAATSTGPTVETAAPAPAAAPRAGVTGQIIWSEPDPPVNIARLPLFLQGVAGTNTQEEYYVLRTDEQGRFEFTNVAPGAYKLVDRVDGKPQWRLRLELAPEQRLALDLTPSNSTRVRDDFPEDR